MSSNVPDEVLEMILSSLMDDHDMSSLKACALVSSVFLPIARSFLFGHVFLLPQPRLPATTLLSRSYSVAPRSQSQPQSAPRSGSLTPSTTYLENELAETNACLKFLRLLSMSPALARHVKRLSVVDGRIFPLMDYSAFHNDTVFSALGLNNTQSPQYYMTRDRLNGPQWFLSTPARTLSLLFQKLNLRSFDLIFQDGPKVPWNEIPQNIHSALNLVFTSPSLQSLELRGVSWDTLTSLHSLTNTLSQSSITHLILRNVKIMTITSNTQPLHRGRSVTPRPSSPLHAHAPIDRGEKKLLLENHHRQFDNPFPHAKPFPDLNIGAQSQNHQNQHLMASEPSSSTNSASDALLRLESLCIGNAASDPALPCQALDTLDLLRALLLNSTDPGGQGIPLINPKRLKRLSIPTVDLDNLPEVLDILTRSGVSTHLETLALNDRLGISTSGHSLTHTNPIPDFSEFTNLRHLQLGIHIYPNPITATAPPLAQALYTHGISLPPPPPPFGTHHTPSTLHWLNHTLDSIPFTLTHLSVTISSDHQVLNTTRHENENDWRALAHNLRSRQSKCRGVDFLVNLTPSVCSGAFGSGLVSMGTLSSTFSSRINSMGGRGRGRTQARSSGSGFTGANVVANGDDFMMVEEKDVKTWFGDMFRGVNLVFC